MAHADQGWGPLAEPFHTDKQLPANAPAWRENVFIAFFDRERQVYGTSHFTGSLNAGGRRARFSVVIDGTARELVEPLAIGGFSTPGVQLHMPDQVRAKGNGIDADLTLAPRYDTVDYSASKALPGLSDAEPLRHYQRSGTLTDTITLDGTTTRIDGGCLRDRTWGYREEIQHWLDYYACFLCFDNFDLTLMKFRTTDHGSHTHGYLAGDRHGHIADARVKRNGWGSITHLTANIDNHEQLDLTVGPPQARIFLPLGEPDTAAAITAYDEFVEVTTPDGLTGFGIIEQGVLRQLD